MVAAVMLAQLERIEELTEERLRLWSRYEAGLADLTDSGVVQAPSSPAHCTHNGHIFFLILKDEETREVLRHALLAEDLRAHTHYVPLHLAPAGKRFGRIAGSMEVTERTATNLLRLPLWNGLPEVDQDRVIAVTHKVIVQT